jgi:hypothetical protein
VAAVSVVTAVPVIGVYDSADGTGDKGCQTVGKAVAEGLECADVFAGRSAVDELDRAEQEESETETVEQIDPGRL